MCMALNFTITRMQSDAFCAACGTRRNEQNISSLLVFLLLICSMVLIACVAG